MRSKHPGSDGRYEPGLERDLDTQLRLFFRQAPQPAVPEALGAAIERLPARRFTERFGLRGSKLLVRPVRAMLVALSVVLAVAIAAGLLDLRGGLYSAPGTPGKPTPVWIPPVSLSPNIEAMGRFDSNTGWVEINSLDPNNRDRATSYLRWTEDGGKTWSERRPVPPTGGLDVQFVDANHGWTWSYMTQPTPGAGKMTATIWRTSDGGISWQSSSIPFGTFDASGVFQVSVHFRDPLHGEVFYIKGPAQDANSGLPVSATAGDWECERFSTSDGGVTWSAPTAMPCMEDIRFVDGGLGYAHDWFQAPVLYVTLDGGQTWTTGTLPKNAEGSNGPDLPMLLERRSDGALRALILRLGSGAGSEYAIVDSRDAGRTWSMVGTASADRATTERYGLPLGFPLAARDENHWLTAPIDYTGTPPWFESSDGGLTWTKFTYAGLSGDVSNFDFLNASDGWAATSSPDTVAFLWATTDGGATWTRVLTTP